MLLFLLVLLVLLLPLVLQVPLVPLVPLLMLVLLVSLVPLVLLGCGPRVMLAFSVFTAVHGLFQHSNLRHRPGALNGLLATADLHRWHHAVEMAEGGCNFGQNLIVWDVVFGTRFSGSAPPRRVGLEGMAWFPSGLGGQLLSPVRWTRGDGPRIEP